MSLDLYGADILEHYKNPVNRGEMKNADANQFEINPLCGDELKIFLKSNNSHISDAKFVGEGCAISLASADILLQQIKGRSLTDVAKMDKQKFLESLGVQISPNRLKCALLGFKAVKLAAIKIISRSDGR